MVGLELEVASRKVDRFGWDAMSTHVRKRLIADWIEALGNYTLDEIRKATRALQTDDPKHITNEQRVKELIDADRGRRLAAIPKREPDPEPPVRDPEMKARIDAIVRNFTTGKRPTNSEE